MIVTALPYIETKGLTLKDVDDLILKVRTQMEDVYKQMSKEVKSQLPLDYPGLIGFEE
jgi:hypothetical protein